MTYNSHMMLMVEDLIDEVFSLSQYYYTPMQRRGQRFFKEYIPLERVFEESFVPDLSSIVENPIPTFPSTPTIEDLIVGEALLTLTKTPVGRGILIGAYALSYLPLLEQTRTSKKYGPSELMLIQGGVGGGLIV